MSVNSVTSAIGKHRIPRYLYHFTTEENYRLIQQGKELIPKVSENDIKKGIFFFELTNFIKNWGVPELHKIGARIQLFTHVLKKSSSKKLVLLRLNTSNLNRDKFLIRTVEDSLNPQRQHFFDLGINSGLYEQKKKPIEYIYPKKIKLSEVEKIGEMEDTSFADTTPLDHVLSTLLKNAPENRARMILQTSKIANSFTPAYN